MCSSDLKRRAGGRLDALQLQSVLDTHERLRATFPELRIGLVHGRLSAAEKAAVMQAFKDGAIQLLVATTVIEVGVDVPNATLMVIENAERMGLAQLHQLRGRVGRGPGHSTCILLYQSALSALARERIAAQGLSHRIEVCPGSFVTDPLPRGADLITLVRVAHEIGRAHV